MSDEPYELFLRYYRNVLRFFRGLEPEMAEDLTQETFLRVFSNMDGFQGGSDYRVVVKFLMTVADSVWKNYLRTKGAKKRGEGKLPSSLDDPDNPMDPGADENVFGRPVTSPFDDAEWRERRVAIDRAIQGLPDRQRRALMLWVYGLSYGEIASAMKTTINAVKSLISQARRQLREEA